MIRKFLPTSIVAASILCVWTGLAAESDSEPIKVAMKYVHKAPKGEKKVSDRIIEGTASDEELKKTLELYKAMVDAKPPRGEQTAHKDRVLKLISATEDVLGKKDGAPATYKTAANCKACHNEHKE